MFTEPAIMRARHTYACSTRSLHTRFTVPLRLSRRALRASELVTHPPARHAHAAADRPVPRLVLDPNAVWERVYESAPPADGGTMCNEHDVVDTMPTAVYVAQVIFFFFSD